MVLLDIYDNHFVKWSLLIGQFECYPACKNYFIYLQMFSFGGLGNPAWSVCEIECWVRKKLKDNNVVVVTGF